VHCEKKEGKTALLVCNFLKAYEFGQYIM